MEDQLFTNQNTIDDIMNGFYECKLKRNANRGFLKWVEKQNKERVKPKLEKVSKQIDLINTKLDTLETENPVDNDGKRESFREF